MGKTTIPNEIKKIKLHDGRPAYIFADAKTGKFPTIGFCCEKNTCPYCGHISNNGECCCTSYKLVQEYNNSLNK